MRKIHELKTWPISFDAILCGSKTFDIRRNDRDFRVGDTLELREYYPQLGEYSGKVLRCEVGFVLDGGQFGLEAGFVCMSINQVRRFDGIVQAEIGYKKSGCYYTNKDYENAIYPTR